MMPAGNARRDHSARSDPRSIHLQRRNRAKCELTKDAMGPSGPKLWYLIASKIEGTLDCELSRRKYSETLRRDRVATSIGGVP